MSVEEVLQTAVAAPLGPLSLTVAPDGGDAWWVNATLHNEPTVGIHVVRDPELSTLRLERQVPSEVPYERWRAAIEARPWVTDSAPMATGGVHVRYWLHAADVSLTMFLSAVADIARITPLSEAAAGSSASRPTTTSRPSTWQTLPTPPTPPVPPPPPPPPPAPVLPPEREPEIIPTAPVTTQPVITPEIAQPALAGVAAAGGICRECGEATDPAHSFCTNCGARLH